MFRPHAYNCPVVVMASECASPVATAFQLAPVGPLTNTGELNGEVNAFIPTCPEVFSPQPHRVPSDLIASV